jgi:atypical dual specificity phosphatase
MTDCSAQGLPESEAELKALKQEGIKAIVSLTATPLNPDIVRKLGFEYSHSHMSGEPTVEQFREILRFVERMNAQSKPVLVHCGEGIDRTGTVLAAYLIYHGDRTNEAIRKVRNKRPGSVQTLEQEKALHEFENFMKQAQRERSQ